MIVAMTNRRGWGLLLVFAVSGLLPAAQADADRPVELGDVQWMRDLDAATAKAKADKKPLLILFQEVPG